MHLGNGLLTSEGEFWLRQRRIAQPAFHRERVASLAQVMTAAVGEARRTGRPSPDRGDAVDVDEEMMRLTRTVVVRALLGSDLGPYTTASTRRGRSSTSTSVRTSGRSASTGLAADAAPAPLSRPRGGCCARRWTT
jgi:cytochrome P450